MGTEISNKIAFIIDQLSDVQQRTGMYTGSNDDLQKFEIFLSGFQTACIALRLTYEVEDLRQAMRERGWERHADGCISQMRERGLSERQMIHDLLEIEKSAWKRYQDRINEV